VFSALGRLHRAGSLTAEQVAQRIDRLVSAPVHRHLLPRLLQGAYGRRQNLRLVDALYVELADQIGAPIVTTDSGLAAATPLARLVVE
jgi:predicted nucleic acid-binding protein